MSDISDNSNNGSLGVSPTETSFPCEDDMICTVHVRTEHLRAVLSNFQLSSFGREKMKFLKLSQMKGLDK